MNSEIKYGAVCWFNASRGFGFITPDDGSKDVFVHYSGVSSEGFKTLVQGQKVSYEIGVNNHNQPKAINVIVMK